MVQRKKKSVSGETENPPASNILLTSEKIVDGISALKKVTKWPKKGTDTIPHYVDESATIYLKFTPKKMVDAHRPGPRGKVALPHPLSYKRNVCYIARGLDHEHQQVDIVDVIKALGIKGTIKAMPLDEVQVSIANKEIDEVNTMVEQFDSYLVDRRASKVIGPALMPVLDEKSRFFTMVNSKMGRREALNEALATSAFVLNTSKNGYLLKVAHTSHSDRQITENIQRALDYVTKNRPGMFLGTWKHFKSIHLKTGDSKGVPIYVNVKDGEVEERFRAQSDVSLSPKAIVEGIAALKEVATWPKHGTKSTPAYNDKSTHVLLQLTPMKMQTPNKTGTLGCLILPHAMSYNRRICFIAPESQEEDEQKAMESVAKELGIPKNITIIPESTIQSAIDDKDSLTMAKFASQYDTYLIDANIPKAFQHPVKAALGAQGKRLSNVFALEQKKGFEMALAKAILLINSTQDGYVLKVAHTSFTDTQIQENVQEALNYIFKFQARLFPGGLKYFRSIHLKAGDSVPVPIYVNDGPDEIDAGISALKNVAAWPQKAPRYSDESATIYLEFTPTKIFNTFKPTCSGTVTLTHALSYNRSVCLIQPPAPKTVAALRELGVVGDIKMIPLKVVRESIADQDDDGLSKLAELFDTYIMSHTARKEICPFIDFAMGRNRKFVCIPDTRHDVKLGLKKSLSKSPLFINSSKDGYELKVAHTSHTDAQIKENIQRVLGCITGHLSTNSINNRYPDELKDLKFIHLKTGVSKRVAIYINEDYVQPNTTPKSVTQGKKPTSGVSVASSVGDATAHMSSGKDKNLTRKRKSNVDATLETPQKRQKESFESFAARYSKSESHIPPSKRTIRRRVRRQKASGDVLPRAQKKNVKATKKSGKKLVPGKNAGRASAS